MLNDDDLARIRHVFANPYDKDICAVIALAKYLCFFPPKENGKLFALESFSSRTSYHIPS